MTVLSSRSNLDSRPVGKWLHFGPTSELHGWLQLDKLVEQGQLRAVKISRKLQEQLSSLLDGRTDALPQAAAVAASSGEDANQVFVIMPFAEPHIDTFDTIRRGVGKANSESRTLRVDELPGAIPITDEIKRLLRTSGLIICDLTEERPNVYYELGLANGLSKKVICIARKGTAIHFDVYGMKVLYFETYRSLEEQLEREVRDLLTD